VPPERFTSRAFAARARKPCRECPFETTRSLKFHLGSPCCFGLLEITIATDRRNET
jgi:hypothetical protein